MAKVAWGALIVGIAGILLGGGVLLVSVLLPSLTDGRTSWDEAMLGIIPGALVLVVSFIIALAGLVMILMKRRQNAQALGQNTPRP